MLLHLFFKWGNWDIHIKKIMQEVLLGSYKLRIWLKHSVLRACSLSYLTTVILKKRKVEEVNLHIQHKPMNIAEEMDKTS